MEDLRLFLHIVDSGSITAGAQQAHLALSSASERLGAIEADAGTALLLRHPRGIRPTEAGATLAHHARLILQQRSQMHDELRSFADGYQGMLHLYANTAALTTFLPARLAPWLAERPQLRMELLERTSNEIVNAIAAGQAEAGLVSDVVDVGELQRQPLADDPLVLLLPRAHHLAGRREVAFAETVDEPFVAMADGSSLQTLIEDQARAAGRALDIRIRMKTFDGQCGMVGHGVGVGILPRNVARRYRRSSGAVPVPLSDPWARRRLCACFGEWSALSAAMRSLLQHLGVVAPD